MSSIPPDSTGKRKRNVRTTFASPPVTMSSNANPTSGEEADAELSYESAASTTNSTTGPQSHHHPAKRAKRHPAPVRHHDDDGEPSSTTESSSAIEARVRLERRPSSASLRSNTSANITSVLPPAELAALCPSGYSMNPPPKDRAVRVYADGVFDLFHLG